VAHRFAQLSDADAHLGPTSVHIFDRARRHLVEAKTQSASKRHERHAFLVSETCEGSALLLAPKRRGATMAMAASSIATAAASAPSAPSAPFVGPPTSTTSSTRFDALVPLLTMERPTGSLKCLFAGDGTGGHVGEVGGVSISRHDGPVTVFALHALDSAVREGTPSSLGLTKAAYVRIQRDAARLLGARML